MSTAAQIEANRQNAKNSTGPRTDQGKAASSQNRLQHGFCGCFRVLPDEDASAYHHLVSSLRDEHRPITPTEHILVERMAQHHWLAQRAMVLQNLLLEDGPVAPTRQRDFALYLRYQTANERAFSKCLRELQTLRALQRKEKIGFEPQTASPNPKSLQMKADEPLVAAHPAAIPATRTHTCPNPLLSTSLNPDENVPLQQAA